MHLLGFIIRIYHDARSPESQFFKFMSVFSLMMGYLTRNEALFQEYIVGLDRLVMMFSLNHSVMTMTLYVQDDQASELCPAYDI